MKNVELQVKNMATKPGRVGATIRLANSGERGPDAELLPEFMRGEMKVGLGRKSGRTTFLTNIDLPINNINVLWNGGVGKTLKEWFAMWTPLMKGPLEYTIGMDTFRDQPLKGRQFLGQMGPQIKEAWPQVLQDWVELKEVPVKSGETYYTANGTKMWLLAKNVVIGRMVTESTRAIAMARELRFGDEEKGMVELMRFLSGIKLTEIDMDKGQKRELRRKVREIEEYLLERGLQAEFNKVYTPSNQKPSRGGTGLGQGFIGRSVPPGTG